jgi:drug/metabolite transporter (DMT)-like permease
MLGVVTVVVNLALLGLIASAADTSDWFWIPFAVWMLAPTVLPCALASVGRPRRWFALVMLVYCVGSALFAALAYFEALYRSESSTAGLIAIFLPIYQCVVLAGCALFGWVRRDARA